MKPIARKFAFRENRKTSSTKQSDTEAMVGAAPAPAVAMSTYIPPRTSSKTPIEPLLEHDGQLQDEDDAASTVTGSRHNSITSSTKTYPTTVQSAPTSLKPLQQGVSDDDRILEPLREEDLDPGSFDLVAPPDAGYKQFNLETRSEQIFSSAHLQVIFSDPSYLLQFTAFLGTHRPMSVPILIYYMDAIKALKAISYSNAIAEALEPINGFEFTTKIVKSTANEELEERAKQAFEVMVKEDLPAFVTHIYIQTVSLSIQRRITGSLPTHLREASEGLAEVFCLTDPSRPDNPIVFASEEFYRTTQYGMSYVIGRNCRFLQGPKTNKNSVRRLRDAVEAGREHYEVFLNYRRDGSPFLNLLMFAPLCDSRGSIRYFIGAQVDISGLAKECSDLESLAKLVEREESKAEKQKDGEEVPEIPKDEFQELSEMLNLQELETVRRWGGRMHKESAEDIAGPRPINGSGARAQPRLLISNSPEGGFHSPLSRASGKLTGIYENYLLVRPYPSLRILFASPTLRVPGILQSPFMAKIGGSTRVRDELVQALADGRGVTAKVRWLSSKNDVEGRSRWIHCTPLLGNQGAIGVWMIVIVDDEKEERPLRMAPPVDAEFKRSRENGDVRIRSALGNVSTRSTASLRSHRRDGGRDLGYGSGYGSDSREQSPSSLRI